MIKIDFYNTTVKQRDNIIQQLKIVKNSSNYSNDKYIYNLVFVKYQLLYNNFN